MSQKWRFLRSVYAGEAGCAGDFDTHKKGFEALMPPTGRGSKGDQPKASKRNRRGGKRGHKC